MRPNCADNAGWYPDPYELAELRYFDGDAWSELVMDDGVPGRSSVDGRDLPTRGRPAGTSTAATDRVAAPPSDPTTAPAPGGPATRGRRSVPTTCAVGPCDAPRLEGHSYCDRHGPAPGYRTARPARPRGRGPVAQPKLVCPHCGTRGAVRTVRTKVPTGQGISGTKAAAAVLTGGLSLFATGLSHRRSVTRASCGECGMTWRVG